MKIEEQVLSREQMAHLKELGVDTSDASMAWFMSPKTKQWKIKVKNNFSHELLLRLSPERYIPTYTIGDLIEKLPKRIGDYYLRIDWHDNDVEYIRFINECEVDWDGVIYFNGTSLINILYLSLCWVAKNIRN